MSGDYTANKPLALVATVVYILPALAHTALVFLKKSHYMWPFVLGAYLEAFGYLTRYWDSAHPGNPDSTPPALVVTVLFIVIAPAWMAASHYMIFKRISLQTRVEQLSLVPIKWTTVLFVCVDVASIFIQIVGGVMSTSDTTSTVKTAETILKVGYIIQVAGLLFFLGLAYSSQRRALIAGVVDERWSKCLTLLFTGGAVILFRAIYRFLEICIKHTHSNGKSTYPLSEHEWTFYVFDTIPVIFITYLFIVKHPSRYIKGPVRAVADVELETGTKERSAV